MTLNTKNVKREPAALINERIKAESLQLITQNGENVGIVSRSTALDMAHQASLDLVLIAENGKDGVPIAKIMDFGKQLYEKKKKLGETKKHQKIIQIKEVKIRPKIGEHDYQTKLKQVLQFLNSGKRVKITLWFKGREATNKQARGEELFDKLNASFALHGLTVGENLAYEVDSVSRVLWSRVYYINKR